MAVMESVAAPGALPTSGDPMGPASRGSFPTSGHPGPVSAAPVPESIHPNEARSRRHTHHPVTRRRRRNPDVVCPAAASRCHYQKPQNSRQKENPFSVHSTIPLLIQTRFPKGGLRSESDLILPRDGSSQVRGPLTGGEISSNLLKTGFLYGFQGSYSYILGAPCAILIIDHFPVPACPSWTTR